MNKVAVIGLDGAAPRLVFELWRDELPNLAALMQRGLWGELRSCHPPITVPAWSSMMSSKDPGQLGFYGFRNRRAYTYDDYAFANSTLIKHDLVWDILSRAGKQSILLGVPQTYPPRQINGHVVSCFLTPSRDSAYTYPPSLKAEVEAVAEGYVFDVEDFRTTDKRKLLQRIYEKTRKHFRVARHLLTTKPWDFFMMVEMGTDRIHHAFWKYFDPEHPKHEPGNEFEHAMREYYRYLDSEVGEVLACIDPDAFVLVVSDHGAKKMDGGICFNEWLIQKGYLKLKAYPDKATPVSPKLIDWSGTRVWADGGYYGRLFLNVKGREPQGVVAPEDYERVRDELITAITAIEDPQGRNIGSCAYRPAELYRETTGVPPDLLVYFGDLNWRSVGSVGLNTIYSLGNDTGPDDANHDWNGICIMRHGRYDDGGVRLDGLHLMDVAPTILQHFDLPIPADMLGKVIDGSRAYSAEDLENSIPFEGKPQVSDVARLILHEFGN
jgi:predicted AlkP superfamily phosphohydrolase/phosphomutase